MTDQEILKFAPRFFPWGTEVKTCWGSGTIQGYMGMDTWLVGIRVKTMPDHLRCKHQGEICYLAVADKDIQVMR